MVDSVVSVRMPASLVQKLKELSKANHFLDVSEEMRSVIRSKAKKYRVKAAEQQAPAKVEQESAVKEELVRRLRQMIEELEDGKSR